MTLAHSRYSHLFENGYLEVLKTGFWRLRAGITPYKRSLADPRKNRVNGEKDFLDESDSSSAIECLLQTSALMREAEKMRATNQNPE